MSETLVARDATDEFVPSGCRFHTRCWKAQRICSEVDPALIEHALRYRAACHFPGA